MPSRKRGAVTILMVPDGGETARAYRISQRGLKVLLGLATLAALLVTLVLGSWMYLAARASQVTPLQARVAELEDERGRMAVLAQRLAELEGQYEQLRYLFGPGGSQAVPELWLPPSGVRAGAESSGGAGAPNRPTSWPLTERGFITQPLVEGDHGNHPGLDIAVPSGSYIRAAGPATVAQVAEDSVYGRYVVLDHGGGYRSMYAHASLTLVDEGSEVRLNEVIALSGSSGRSSAPHLHFEVHLDGRPVDPLTVVRRR